MSSGELVQPSGDALIKAARSLDQSSADSIPDTLSNLWSLLSKSAAGSFHASEELILRWLLKNMNGSATAAEQFRRYPMAWNVMASVFGRVPLFSLAKSLADRRFIPILQRTLKEISNPQNATSAKADPSSDVEMADAESASTGRTSKKRKRSPGVLFDLKDLQKPRGCLRTAESLFDALRTLLARLDSVEAGVPSNVRMGAEHVKSLFSSPAKDAMEILGPMLSICDLALNEQEPEPAENEDTWLSTFGYLWDLHLQSSGDAAEVAMSLYPTGSILLAKLDRSKDLVVDPHVKATWTRDLRRFFIKNMILPARASFLNRKDIAIIKAAVDVTSFMPTASCPVLFSLAIKTPYSFDDASAKKDHEDWTQKVFEIIEEPMRAAEPVRRNPAMKVVLDTAMDSKSSISLEGLRTVCRKYTSESGKLDLKLVSRVADVDVDVFLISVEGQTLLDDILEQVTNLDDSEFQVLAETDLVDFIVSLAKGSAKGRNLPWFIVKWVEVLSECLAKGEEYATIKRIWSSTQIIDTVSDLLQPSINTMQLGTLLGQLESQEATFKRGALLVILDAISRGITEEEFIDAVNIRLFELASKTKLKCLEGSMVARWWRIVEKTVSQSKLNDVGLVWTKVESDLKKALKKGDLVDPATLAAFRCCSAFWLANHPGGPHESEASSMTWTFLQKLKKDGGKATQTESSHSLSFFESCRVVDLVARSDLGTEFLPDFLAYTDMADLSSFPVRSVLYNEVNLGNQKYANALVNHAMTILAREQGNKSKWAPQQVNAAIQILLDVPSEAITRERREQIMPSTLYFISKSSKKHDDDSLDTAMGLLSLMIKLMKKPTFYEGMKFADLVTIGQSLVANIEAKGDATDDSRVGNTYGALKLFEALALLSLKQMTSNLDKRERAYLTEASQIALGWPVQVAESQPYHPILLKSLVVAIEASKRQAQAIADPVVLREHLSLMLAHCLTADYTSRVCDDANWLKQSHTTCFTLIVIEQLDEVQPAVIKSRLLPSKTELERISGKLCGKGAKAGWRLKGLLFECFGEAISDPFNVMADIVLRRSDADKSEPRSVLAGPGDIHKYIDVVLKTMNDDARGAYFGAIGQRLRDDRDITGHLLAIYRLIRLEHEPSLRSTAEKVDFAALQSVLASRLSKSGSAAEFVLIGQTMELLLDKKASAMKQWNTEVTLSTISTICATLPRTAEEVRSSPGTYLWLCRLVEVLIKRHRLRLEGHFHLLITALQSLLRLLIAPKTSLSSTNNTTTTTSLFTLQQKQAVVFSRLLTLICEPSVASVTRGQAPGALDSAVDAAKRSAGQHMYLVLMLYIKLQLEHPVPRVVREALQSGVYSILDITTPEGRRILNEAVDGSGRAIFRELYKQYVKFGKWSGV
ncbi:Nucleolar pre-ribosomal-associated protein 2 [Cytospora mali]|uniref:Nucleolar pre-ribosomal-associated protein 2 n=1 Tax=Cytospora mali TaxID=578113 RepID=A0A194V5T1_CYTMA|nr:Nucleolar pre-ribosomal-associated protein 2 [Valsa mali var. pyri (nom. inval.)]